MTRYTLFFTVFALLICYEGRAQSSTLDVLKERFGKMFNVDGTDERAIDSIKYLFYKIDELETSILTANKCDEYFDDYYEMSGSRFDRIILTKFTRCDVHTSNINHLWVNTISSGVTLSNTKINKLEIVSEPTHQTDLLFSNCNLDSIWLTFGHLDLRITGATTTNFLSVSNARINFILFDTLPKTLIFSEVDFTDQLTLEGTGMVSRLGILANNISNLRITNYEQFHLDFSWREFTYDEKVDVYTRLLDNFKARNQERNYEKLDKEFQSFKLKELKLFGSQRDWLLRNWWDYGYDKFQVIINAALLSFFFFIVNLCLYKKLINEGYQLQKFRQRDSELIKKYENRKTHLFFARIPYIILYTGYIFWGWKLDLHSINIRKIALFGYVLIQYLIGIICLAYIVNIIITH